mmetsp:Transcript_3232/g.6352  ORF Transcript_3232/g.6352 Transcript_3232/m.6352 type:complete len:223 (+) Transcript_3232:81-749(+)
MIRRHHFSVPLSDSKYFKVAYRTSIARIFLLCERNHTALTHANTCTCVNAHTVRSACMSTHTPTSIRSPIVASCRTDEEQSIDDWENEEGSIGGAFVLSLIFITNEITEFVSVHGRGNTDKNEHRPCEAAKWEDDVDSCVRSENPVIDIFASYNRNSLPVPLGLRCFHSTQRLIISFRLFHTPRRISSIVGHSICIHRISCLSSCIGIDHRISFGLFRAFLA